jgi:hypothetical protein
MYSNSQFTHRDHVFCILGSREPLDFRSNRAQASIRAIAYHRCHMVLRTEGSRGDRRPVDLAKADYCFVPKNIEPAKIAGHNEKSMHSGSIARAASALNHDPQENGAASGQAKLSVYSTPRGRYDAERLSDDANAYSQAAIREQLGAHHFAGPLRAGCWNMQKQFGSKRVIVGASCKEKPVAR